MPCSIDIYLKEEFRSMLPDSLYQDRVQHLAIHEILIKLPLELKKLDQEFKLLRFFRLEYLLFVQLVKLFHQLEHLVIQVHFLLKLQLQCKNAVFQLLNQYVFVDIPIAAKINF